MNRTSRSALHLVNGTSALKHDRWTERGTVIEYPRARREQTLYGRTVSVHMVPGTRRAPRELGFREAARMGVAEAFEPRESDMAGSWNGRTEVEARTLYAGTSFITAFALLIGLLPFMF